MPLYPFKHPDGRIFWEVFAMKDVPDAIHKDGAECPMDYQAKLNGFQDTNAAGWPRQSDAMGCHPMQAKEFERWAEKKGVPTRWDKDGCAVVESPEHQKKLVKAFGWRDYQSYE